MASDIVPRQSDFGFVLPRKMCQLYLHCSKVLSIVMLLVLILSCAIFSPASAARTIVNPLSPVEGYDGMSNALSSKVGEHIPVRKLSDTYPSDPYYGYQPSRRRP